MIKFFRRIRQNLISKGKNVKYFKYAVGEIVLVVIGILIALQVNNWNEKQKQDAEFEIVLEQFYNAVKNDTEAFNAYENRIDEQIKLIDTLLIKPESFPIELLPHILGYLAVEDINNYISETNHHISNLKYNINNPKQNELSKQITSYVNLINKKMDFGLVDRINPLFYEIGIAEPSWNFNEIVNVNGIDNYYSQDDYSTLYDLVRTSRFQAILKTLRRTEVKNNSFLD